MGYVGSIPWATRAIFFAAKLHRDTGVCFAVISLSVVLHLGCNLLARNKRDLVFSKGSKGSKGFIPLIALILKI